MSYRTCPALELSGEQIGTLSIDLTYPEAHPAAVRDQYGSTWVLRWSVKGATYQRVECLDATLEVRT